MEASTNIILKSEKESQKKKKRIVWIIAAVLLVTTVISFIADYSSYKKGQEFGLTSAIVSSEIAGSSWVDEGDSYAEQCKSVYIKLNAHTYDITLNGVKYDASDVRESESALRGSFAKVMEAGGYDRYNSYSIMDWFKYTNPIEYYTGYYATKTLPILLYIFVLFSIIFTLLVNREAKKELVVYNSSVLCKYNSKKAKQIVFEDISNVDFGKNSLKLIGTGIKFKISNLTNAEDIKSVILEKKTSTQKDAVASVSASVSSADELKKYKDLLDTGVISQEEFDVKKKQILGL